MAGPSKRRVPTFHQLRLLIAVAESLHFGQAARSLGLSQSAVSMQINQLEETLGVRMFARTSQAVDLTEDGYTLLPSVAETVIALERLMDAAATCSSRISLTVGVADTAWEQPVVAAFLRHLRAVHPPIEVRVRQVPFGRQFQSLATGEVDVALLHLPVPAESLDAVHLHTGPRAVCLRADDALARVGTPVTLADLAPYAVLDPPAGLPEPWRAWWAADPRPDGTPVAYGPVVRDIPSTVDAVAAGRGIAILPAGLRSSVVRPRVVMREVIDAPPAETALVWRPDTTTPAVKAAHDIATVLAATDAPLAAASNPRPAHGR